MTSWNIPWLVTWAGTNRRNAVALALCLVSAGLACGDDPAGIVKIASLDDATSIATGTTSVFVDYDMAMSKQFTQVMKALAATDQLGHLTLRIPNSSHVREENLEVLREFRSLTSLTLRDCRDWKEPTVFDHVGTLGGLQHLVLEFR